MYRVLLAVVLFMLISSAVFSQELDSLIYFSDLTFSSRFEEMVFSRVEKQQEVGLDDLYLAIDVASESEAKRYKANLNALVNRLKKEGVGEKKKKKQVKQIYEETHADLMILYDEEAYFPDLFKNGNFNCVTGSIVYSLIFQAFDIPFSIQKGMNHVSLVAFPETSTILVESTDSEEGIKSMNRGDKTAFVNQLSRGKMISQEQRLQSNVTSIFMQYALAESEIDSRELASYQYSNRAMFSLSELEYHKAFQDFEKAFYLKPGLEHAGMLLQTGGIILHVTDYSDPVDVMVLCKLARFKDLGITDDDVYAEFARMTQKIYYEQKDPEGFEEAFQMLIKHLESEALVLRISQGYYGELIDNLVGEANLTGALEYMDDLYALDPDNKQILKAVRDILITELSSSIHRPTDQLLFLDRYRGQFPEVYEMQLMKMVDVATQARAAAFYFNADRAEAGHAGLDRMEEGIAGVENINMIASDVQSAYEMAAFYYYERASVKNARKILDRGLKVLPGNQRLKYMRNSI